jgi:hypothetical protein
MQLDEAHGVLLEPGPGRKLERPELLVFEIQRSADGGGVAPHIHREHADAFYVLEGEMDFHLAGETVCASAGWFVLSPPGDVHGFGPQQTRVLGGRRLHHAYEVGRGPATGRIGNYLGAGLRVGVVAVAGFLAGSLLDRCGHSGGGEPLDGVRHRRHAPLSGGGLAGHEQLGHVCLGSCHGRPNGKESYAARENASCLGGHPFRLLVAPLIATQENTGAYRTFLQREKQSTREAD